LFPRTRRWTWVNIHFCAKKNQTFTVDHWSRLISTYLSMYLELSLTLSFGPRFLKCFLAQLSLIFLVLSYSISGQRFCR
jgi:hypothetical protein